MKTLICFLLLATSSFGLAARHNRAHEVAEIFYGARCDQRCQQGVLVEYYKAQDFNRLPTKVYEKLQAVAFDQSQVWGDTILEGDYVANGKTDLDEVMVIKRDGRLVGFAITYSEKAWYVGNCTYIHKNPNSLTSCNPGRISERSFVTSDFAEAEVDQNRFADFHAKE
jgi:hypothetical protein